MDNVKNFAKTTVGAGYDASATSVVLSSGHGAKLPSPPFNAVWWNSTDFPDPSDDPNVEIVRVTAVSTDTLAVTRGQEGTAASTKNTSGKTYKLTAGFTAKVVNTDIAAILAQVCQGRLTLQTGVAVPTTDQTAKTTIYFTPYGGNKIGLYDGSAWNFYSFSELSLALGTLTADKNYDVFIYNNAGTLTLELSAAWTNATARADALTLQDGVYVKSGATTRRYLGTFRTVSTTETEDSVTKRFLWNNHHRVIRDLYLRNTTSHSYTGNYRQWNNSSSIQVAFVAGLAEDAVEATVNGDWVQSGAAAGISIGVDVTNAAYRGFEAYSAANSGNTFALGPSFMIPPQIGYHFLAALESTFGQAASTFANINIGALVQA